MTHFFCFKSPSLWWLACYSSRRRLAQLLNLLLFLLSSKQNKQNRKTLLKSGPLQLPLFLHSNIPQDSYLYSEALSCLSTFSLGSIPTRIFHLSWYWNCSILPMSSFIPQGILTPQTALWLPLHSCTSSLEHHIPHEALLTLLSEILSPLPRQSLSFSFLLGIHHVVLCLRFPYFWF